MNIVYHHRTQGTGAEGVHISYVIKGLRDLGHNVTVVSPNNQEPSSTAGNNPYAKKSGFKKIIMASLSKALPQIFFEMLELIYNFFVMRKLYNILKKSNVDFIYERQAFFLYAGAKLAKRYKIPLIVEVNEVAGEERVRQQIFIKIAKYIENYIFKEAKAIIVVSEFLKEKIIENGIEEKKIFVIPNGVDEVLFNPENTFENHKEKYHLKDDKVVIGFIGWFVAWHNLELLIRVVARIAKRHKVSLVLVGDGILKEKFKVMIKELNIEESVVFPGAVLYQVIPEYVSMMDICVIPGSNEYRSPIKLFEYMAMGKSVIAPRYRPIERIIKHNDNGIIFNPDDEESLYEELLALVTNLSKRKYIGKNAREHIIRHHLWKHNAERVINIYQGNG